MVLSGRRRRHLSAPGSPSGAYAGAVRVDMVAVGLELLAERGLNLGLGTVRFDEVIAASDAPLP